jgi:hypothetical protein
MNERPEVDCIETMLDVLAPEQGGLRSPLTTAFRGGLIVFPEWYETWVGHGTVAV